MPSNHDRGRPPREPQMHRGWLRSPLTLAVAILAMLAGAARAAEEPPLLPLTALFAHPGANWDYRISPDGSRLAWVAMSKGRATLHFRRLDETAARTVETPRELR